MSLRAGAILTLFTLLASSSGCVGRNVRDTVGPDGAPNLEARLRDAVPEDPWAAVPPPYREWAQDQLDTRMRIAVAQLGEQPAEDQLARAVELVPRLVAVIAEAARARCTPRQCLYDHATAPKIHREVNALLCPGFFPFC